MVLLRPHAGILPAQPGCSIVLARYNNVHLSDRGRRELGKIGAVQLIAIVGSQLLGHAIRRTAPEKRGRIGVGRAVDAHNIRPGRQSLHRRDKIFHHGVFTVGIILLIGVTL